MTAFRAMQKKFDDLMSKYRLYQIYKLLLKWTFVC